MSVFNKKCLGKSTAYLMASVSMSSTLIQNLSEIKVFANDWEKYKTLLASILSWIFSKYSNAAEKVTRVLEYARSVFEEDSGSNKDANKKSNNNKKSSDVNNELKNSEYKDIFFNEEDLKLVKKFTEYTSKPVKLGNNDEYIEKVIDNVYGRGIEGKTRFELLEVDLKNNFVNIKTQEDLRFPAYTFGPILKKLDSNQSDEISFSKGENNSIVLTDRDNNKKVSFTVGSDGTIFLKTFLRRDCYVLPLRVAANGLMFATKIGDRDLSWVYLDPLGIVDLFFERCPYVSDDVEKKLTVRGDLEKMYEIFSEKPGCEMLADAAKQAVALYKALESCYKKIFNGKMMELDAFSDTNFLLDYRKKLLKMILNGEVPEGCDKETFENLRKHTINYFKYLGGFDFKDQKEVKENQEDSMLNSQNIVKTS